MSSCLNSEREILVVFRLSFDLSSVKSETLSRKTLRYEVRNLSTLPHNVSKEVGRKGLETGGWCSPGKMSDEDREGSDAKGIFVVEQKGLQKTLAAVLEVENGSFRLWLPFRGLNVSGFISLYNILSVDRSSDEILQVSGPTSKLVHTSQSS